MGKVEAKRSEPSESKTGCGPIILFKGIMSNLGCVRRGSSETADAICSQIENEKPQQFSRKELTKYTSDFSHRLGSGGFGSVYKGQLPSGVPIAVKVLKDPKRKDATKTSFIAEVSTISKTYHRNLVKLLGFCYDADTIALVYEFVVNGSLDSIFYRNPLNLKFEQLFDIATDTARGISYLHEECPSLIIHYDIKPANVLIDSSFCPKVADFGLAKLCNVELSHITLDRGRGTPGYIAPELISNLPIKVNCKCDVYSFGIMLFEILRRKRNSSHMAAAQEWFPDRVWRKFKQGLLDAVLNECEIEDKNRDKAKRMSMVALMCAQYESKNRPSMSKVVKILEGEIGYEGEKTILRSNKSPSGLSLTESASTCAESSSPAEISSTSDGNFTARRSTSDGRRVPCRSTLQKSTCEVKTPAQTLEVNMATIGEENITTKYSQRRTKSDKRREDQNANRFAVEGEIETGETETELKLKLNNNLEKQGKIRAIKRNVVSDETTQENAIEDAEEKKERRMNLEKTKSKKRKEKKQEEAGAVKKKEGKQEENVLAKTEAVKSKHRENNEVKQVKEIVKSTREGAQVNEDIAIKRTSKDARKEKLKGTDTESDKGNRRRCGSKEKEHCQSFHGNGVSYGFGTRPFDDEDPNACSIL